MSDDKKFRGHPRDWQGSRPAATESMRLPVSQRKEITDERLKEVAEEVFAQITGLFNSGPTSEDVRMNGAIGVLRSLLNEAK